MLQKTSRPEAMASGETENAVDIEIGKRIKKRRLQLRHSQTALGAAVGVSFQQIQKYEGGTNRVSASTLYEMARVLDAPITYFFDTLAVEPSASANLELERKAQEREEFVATEEGQRLVDAFVNIPKRMRPKFISLLASFPADH